MREGTGYPGWAWKERGQKFSGHYFQQALYS